MRLDQGRAISTFLTWPGAEHGGADPVQETSYGGDCQPPAAGPRHGHQGQQDGGEVWGRQRHSHGGPFGGQVQKQPGAAPSRAGSQIGGSSLRLVTIPVHIRADIVDVDIYIGHISTNTILTNGLLGFIFLFSLHCYPHKFYTLVWVWDIFQSRESWIQVFFS